MTAHRHKHKRTRKEPPSLKEREKLLARLKQAFDFMRGRYKMGVAGKRKPVDATDRGAPVTWRRYRLLEWWMYHRLGGDLTAAELAPWPSPEAPEEEVPPPSWPPPGASPEEMALLTSPSPWFCPDGNRWALEYGTVDTRAAVELELALEDVAAFDVEAWHALLMIRIILGAHDRLSKLPDQDWLTTEHPRVMEELPATSLPYTQALSVEMVQPTPIGDAYGLPPRPTTAGRSRRDRNEQALVEWAIGVCIRHGMQPTRRRDSNTVESACSLVARALTATGLARLLVRCDDGSEPDDATVERAVERVWERYRKGEGSDHMLGYTDDLFDHAADRRRARRAVPSAPEGNGAPQ